MSYVSDVWYLLGRHLRAQLRMPVFIFVSIVQPMFWLILFSQLFRSLADLPDFPTGSYLQFFAPGVLVMLVLFGSTYSGMSMIRDMDLGVITKMLATPATRVSIVLSRVLSTIVVLIVQCSIILIVAWVMGVSIVTGIPGALLMIVFLGLFGLGFAGLSNCLAILFKKPEPLMGVLTFLTLPLMFLSSAMMPSTLLPTWIDAAKKFNPVQYAIEPIRSLVTTGYDWPTLLIDMAILTAFAALTVGLASAMFRIKGE